MPIASRTKKIAFFITLGSALIGVAIALNVSWIVLNWREFGALILGIIFFAFLIAGVVLNTVFLVREIRRNEQQDSFLNAVTHELKTPVASIRLYLQTLQQRQLDESKQRDFYRIMQEDTDRLMGTIDQVLKAGEVRHGASENHREAVNLAEVVRDSVELAILRRHLAPGAMQLERIPDGELVVSGNLNELRTVVANLLDNAVKYTGPEKKIAVELFAPDMDTVLLRVRDNGIGIPPPELKRIFRRFYRINAKATSAVRGTGLGLFIVRSIVRRHGGEITAESAGEGGGSTFTVRLPRVYRT